MSGVTTESTNPKTANLDQLSTLEIVRAINDEDRTVAEAVSSALENIAACIDRIAEKLAAGGRLFYVGTGTSGRLGVLDAVECPPTFGVSPDVVQGIIAGGYGACYGAVEAAEDDKSQAVSDVTARRIGPGDAVVGIAASGSTPYTVSAIRQARSLGAFTAGIACNPGSPLSTEAEIGIEIDTGPEALAGSTRMKAGTAQKMVLNIISTGVMVRLGHVYGNLMVNVHLKNRKLVKRGEGIVQRVTGAGNDEAKGALEATGSVKAAIILLKLGCKPDRAVQLSREVRNLRDVIG